VEQEKHVRWMSDTQQELNLSRRLESHVSHTTFKVRDVTSSVNSIQILQATLTLLAILKVE
jgi:hypothetical protein